MRNVQYWVFILLSVFDIIDGNAITASLIQPDYVQSVIKQREARKTLSTDIIKQTVDYVFLTMFVRPNIVHMQGRRTMVHIWHHGLSYVYYTH